MAERKEINFGDLRGLEAGQVVYLDKLAFMVMDSRPSMEIAEVYSPLSERPSLEIELRLRRCPSMDKTG